MAAWIAATLPPLRGYEEPLRLGTALFAKQCWAIPQTGGGITGHGRAGERRDRDPIVRSGRHAGLHVVGSTGMTSP